MGWISDHVWKFACAALTGLLVVSFGILVQREIYTRHAIDALKQDKVRAEEQLTRANAELEKVHAEQQRKAELAQAEQQRRAELAQAERPGRTELEIAIKAPTLASPGGVGVALDKPVAIFDKPQPVDIKALQQVFFATNRKILPRKDFELASITSDRSSEMQYGLAIVSVPKSHTIGHVERPSSWIFGLITRKETNAEDFRIQKLTSFSRDQFIDSLRTDTDSVMLFIHGYNVSFADAVFKAAQIAYDANFGGTVVVFSWPSMGGLLLYDFDRESALFSAGDLLGLLRILTEEIPKKKLFVVAHSLGNQIVVDALQQAALSKIKLNISELVLAAPDVDKDVFMTKAAQIKSVAGKITMYASSEDKALLVSDKKARGARMGYIDENGPHLVDGIETIDVSAVGNDMFGLNHSTFSNDRTVLDDLGRLIVSGTHPPSLRSPILRDTPDKTHPKYWMYPK